MRVSEIRVKRIRVNQGLGVGSIYLLKLSGEKNPPDPQMFHRACLYNYNLKF